MSREDRTGLRRPVAHTRTGRTHGGAPAPLTGRLGCRCVGGRRGADTDRFSRAVVAGHTHTTAGAGDRSHRVACGSDKSPVRGRVSLLTSGDTPPARDMTQHSHVCPTPPPAQMRTYGRPGPVRLQGPRPHAPSSSACRVRPQADHAEHLPRSGRRRPAAATSPKAGGSGRDQRLRRVRRTCASRTPHPPIIPTFAAVRSVLGDVAVEVTLADVVARGPAAVRGGPGHLA